MPQNFLGCDREQVFLLPPSVDDWLPADHFARFVIAAIEELDLDAFYADYRADGHGRPAHDPAMMVALLVYAYARGQRSSRVIERACIEDIAFRVIAANRRPDHTTIARFRQRHETALAGLFGELYPNVVDGSEEEGGVPSRLLKTDRRKAEKEGTPWWMFAGSRSGRTTRSPSRSMSWRARVRAG
jgi:transposase